MTAMDKVLAGRRLLVVEDEMLILMMIEDMLEALGCTSIQSAGTNEKALALLASQDFDAVMLDMNLNGTSSQPVAKALAVSGTPFVYSTGGSLDQIDEGFKDRPSYASLSRLKLSQVLSVALSLTHFRCCFRIS